MIVFTYLPVFPGYPDMEEASQGDLVWAANGAYKRQCPTRNLEDSGVL